MAPRAPIIAGKTVILLQVQDTIDSALLGVRRKLNKFAADLGKVSLELFTGGIATGIPLALELNKFREFEDRILFLSTKLKTTDIQFAKVVDTIRELGRTTSFTAQEVVESAVALAQAGFSAKELINTLQPVLDLARGAQIDLGSSAAILANTMRVFSIETEKSAEVASQFIAAARLGVLDVLDLKESLKEVVGTLNVLNIDLPTSLALVTQLAESSLRGTKAGTSLNTMLLNLANRQDVLKDTFGINITDAEGNMRPLITVLNELLAAIEPLGNTRRLAVLQRLFNIRGGRAATGLLRDLERTAALADEIRNAGNEAREAAKIMDSEFGGAIRFATSALQDLSLEIGKIVSGPLTQFLRVVPGIANSLQELLRINPKLVLTFAAIPPIMVAAGVAGLALSFALGKIASVIGTLGGVAGSVGSIINKALTGQLIVALQATTALQRGFKKIDAGAAATFLGPQDPAKVLSAERRVANARAALRKAQIRGSAAAELAAEKKLAAAVGRLRKANTSSFLGRVGSTPITTRPLTAAGSGIVKSVSNIGSALNQAFSSTTTVLARVSTSIETFFKKLSQSLRIQGRFFNRLLQSNKAFESSTQRIRSATANLSHYNAEFTRSIATQRQYAAEAKKFQRAALDSVAVQDRQIALQTQLRRVTAQLADAQAPSSTPGNRLEALTGRRALQARRARIAALAEERRAILSQLELARRDDPDIENLIRKSELAEARVITEKQYRKNLATTIRSERTALATAERSARIAAASRQRATVGLRAFRLGRIGTQTTSVTSSISRVTASLGTVLRRVADGGLRLFIRGLQALTRIDYVRILSNTFRATLGIARGFFIAANAVRRFVFSFSGILTIAELLLIFGPRIEFIRKGLERLSKGFSDAFGRIGSIIRDAAPALDQFREGIKQIFAGEGAFGVTLLTGSIKNFLKVVGANFRLAFNDIIIAVAPAFDFIRRGLLSTIELAKLLGSIFGATFTTLTSGINSVTGGGSGSLFQTIIDTVKNAFSKDSIKNFFIVTGRVFIELALRLNKVFEAIFQVVNTAMSNISAALAGFFDLILKASLRSFSNLPEGGISGIFKTIAGDIAAASEPIRNSLKESADKQQEASNQLSSIFSSFPVKLESTFDKFLANLDTIFARDTEANARAAQARAEADRKAAQDAATKAARDSRTGRPNTLPFQFGGLLAQLPGRLGTLLGQAAPRIQQAFTAPTVPQLSQRVADFFKPIGAALAEQARNIKVDPAARIAELRRENLAAQQRIAGRQGAFDSQRQLQATAPNVFARSLTPGAKSPFPFAANIPGNLGVITQMFADGEFTAGIQSLFKSEERLAQQRLGLQQSNAIESKNIKERRAEIQALIAQQRATALGPRVLQAGSIQDIAATTVTDTVSRRFNKFALAVDSPQEKQVDLLQEVSNKLGGGGGADSYLKTLVDKTGPLVFTQ